MCVLNVIKGPDPREIICTVINPSPNGEMVWMIGDEVQTNNNPVETNDYGDWQQSFNLVPSVGIDDKRFRCLLVQHHKRAEAKKVDIYRRSGVDIA